MNDAKVLWQSINWKGTFDTPSDAKDGPSDETFCEFYAKLLSADNYGLTYEPSCNRIIPILDNDISPFEVETQLKLLKANKAAGTMD